MAPEGQPSDSTHGGNEKNVGSLRQNIAGLWKTSNLGIYEYL